MYQQNSFALPGYGSSYGSNFSSFNFGPISTSFGSTSSNTQLGSTPINAQPYPSDLQGSISFDGGQQPFAKQTRYTNSSDGLDAPANVIGYQAQREAWALTDPDQLSQFGLMQQMEELQRRMVDSLARFTSTNPSIAQLRHVWTGQADANSMFQQYAQSSLYSKRIGWNNTGRISDDGSSIMRFRKDGSREAITSYMLLEIEDCSPWKAFYTNPQEHRLDGPEGSAFVGKHPALALGLCFGQLEVVHGYSSNGQGIKRLTAAEIPHKMVSCHYSEEAYVRRHLPHGFNIITTSGRSYKAYTIYDFAKTSKIDSLNMVRVCRGQPTDVGRERIRGMAASVKQTYLDKLEQAKPNIPESAGGGLTGEWPWPLDAEDMMSLSSPETPPTVAVIPEVIAARPSPTYSPYVEPNGYSGAETVRDCMPLLRAQHHTPSMRPAQLGTARVTRKPDVTTPLVPSQGLASLKRSAGEMQAEAGASPTATNLRVAAELKAQFLAKRLARQQCNKPTAVSPDVNAAASV
ncbi:hypothetical protein LTR36_008914 [Oleoguttula mirabilis]|uniref:Uncharacterized protein n=1 Tax=Oleoguttula mirabilis TaxID=1507867 RepID=A0AAV9J7A2_9PEZI|nr:hypothetical protein LTR36_008914 [Oleoguttula mirabilis]